MTEAPSASLAGIVGTWQLDPKTTIIEFHTTAMWGLSKVTGSIRAVEGSGAVGDDGAVSGELVLDAASVDTKIKRRDTHLRSRHFFDVGTYPTLTFTASEVTPLPDGTLRINGTLRVKDQSHPIEVVATLTAPSVERITVSGEVAIDRRRWGLTRATMGAGLENRVVLLAQFVRL